SRLIIGALRKVQWRATPWTGAKAEVVGCFRNGYNRVHACHVPINPAFQASDGIAKRPRLRRVPRALQETADRVPARPLTFAGGPPARYAPLPCRRRLAR